jgi:hypothetical protein
MIGGWRFGAANGSLNFATDKCNGVLKTDLNFESKLCTLGHCSRAFLSSFSSVLICFFMTFLSSSVRNVKPALPLRRFWGVIVCPTASLFEDTPIPK